MTPSEQSNTQVIEDLEERTRALAMIGVSLMATVDSAVLARLLEHYRSLGESFSIEQALVQEALGCRI